jgi:hypothetical protein
MEPHQSKQAEIVVLDILLRAVAVLSECQRAKEDTAVNPVRSADQSKGQTTSFMSQRLSQEHSVSADRALF